MPKTNLIPQLEKLFEDIIKIRKENELFVNKK